VGGEQPAARHPCNGGGGSAAPSPFGVSVFLVFSCVLEFDADSFFAIREGLKRDRSHVRWKILDRLNRTFLFFHVFFALFSLLRMTETFSIF
jgi:hypothetical protein